MGTAQYKFDHWRREDGLPDNSVSAILQTSDGYLWLGTQRVLARFDGVRYTIFNTRNTSALRNNAIEWLLEDNEKTLWIGTAGGGITRLSSGQFSTLTKVDGLSSNCVPAMCQHAEWPESRPVRPLCLGGLEERLYRAPKERLTRYAPSFTLTIFCDYPRPRSIQWIKAIRSGPVREVTRKCDSCVKVQLFLILRTENPMFNQLLTEEVRLDSKDAGQQ